MALSGHVEAGLRTYDLSAPFPEEMNRQAISKIAHVHFAPTLVAVQCLERDNVPLQHIHHTSTCIDLGLIVWCVLTDGIWFYSIDATSF